MQSRSDHEIVADLNVHPAVIFAHAGSTAAARVSSVVVRDQVSADSWRIVFGRRNLRPLATALKRRNGFGLGRIPGPGLYLRAVNAVAHAKIICLRKIRLRANLRPTKWPAVGGAAGHGRVQAVQPIARARANI